MLLGDLYWPLPTLSYLSVLHHLPEKYGLDTQTGQLLILPLALSMLPL